MTDLQAMVETAASRHGTGTVYTLLEALGRTHSIQIEVAHHNCFLKAFYPKSSPPVRSATTSTHCPSGGNSLRCTRDAILRMRPPPALQRVVSFGNSLPSPLEVFDMAARGDDDAEDGFSL